MAIAKTMLCCLAGTAALLMPAGAPAAAANCHSPDIGSKHVPMVRPALSAVVIGSGRVQFYSAPSRECAISGTFIVPNDTVIMYAQTDDFRWSWVAYVGGATPLEVSGWVFSDRLKITGEMGPRN